MHEAGLMRGLIKQLDELARVHGCDRIAAVKLSIRESGGYSAEHFKEHFCAVSGGSCAQDAALDIDVTTDELHIGAPQITIVSIEVPE
jgi:Zn finger protein HypA/HybF involved in hydrogenase expression